MTSRPALYLRIEALSDAAVARSLVVRVAQEFGFERRCASELALAASELVTNIVKYAGAGELLIGAEPGALVVTALDRGPGPPSEAELFGHAISRGAQRLPEHGISTGLGTGGGALTRLCDEVEIEARPGGGAIIRCRKRRSGWARADC